MAVVVIDFSVDPISREGITLGTVWFAASHNMLTYRFAIDLSVTYTMTFTSFTQ